MSAEAFSLEVAVVNGYKFCRLTEGQIAEFSAWSKQQALIELSAMKTEVDANIYKELLTSFVADCAAGAYRWGHFGPGHGIARLITSADGIERIVTLMVSKFHPNVEGDAIRQLLREYPKEVGTAIKECVIIPPS